ncbi:cytochrome P450 [Mycobacterium sp. WUMAC-067]|uniref:cytochrome P450 n=1 Tax=unclassified Mycobacterium TaxID=2642494 RepID=UPI001CDA2858|nr:MULTISPECIES: cytochrome P450 [unclassified Mycobacterium]MCA2244789.1 cytochrome P450 [Mycobacterium sp. WUMAC-067]MCA2315999.1 cytochrome P450 [Mycobacterium sp. WUMAC-025]
MAGEHVSPGGVTEADAPIARFDFVNGSAGMSLSAKDPHQRNHAMALRRVVALGDGALVCSRELVTETLTSPAVFSSADLVEQGNTLPLIPLGIDPPDHGRYRKLLDPMFSPRRMDAQEADIAERVNHFIDMFIDRGSCDFTAEFAELFPSAVFLGLMGLPWDQLDELVRLREGLLHPGSPDSTPAQRSAIQRQTAQEVYSYFDAILDQRAADPHGDLLTEIVTSELDGRPLSREDALSICFVLLTAGLDTVTDSLTCFWAYLARHPRQRQRIAEDNEVIPRAVEELLRWETPVPLVVRWARKDSRIGDQTVGAGQHVLVSLSAANVDPAQFSDPLEVNLDRRGNSHLAFGGGAHRCLGSHLARRELRIAMREWHRRIPEYTLAPGYEVRYRPPMRFVPDLQLVWPGNA